jgi:hypothetical protein
VLEAQQERGDMQHAQGVEFSDGGAGDKGVTTAARLASRTLGRLLGGRRRQKCGAAAPINGVRAHETTTTRPGSGEGRGGCMYIFTLGRLWGFGCMARRFCYQCWWRCREVARVGETERATSKYGMTGDDTSRSTARGGLYVPSRLRREIDFAWMRVYIYVYTSTSLRLCASIRPVRL